MVQGEGLFSGAAGAQGDWGEHLITGLCFMFCHLTEAPLRA